MLCCNVIYHERVFCLSTQTKSGEVDSVPIGKRKGVMTTCGTGVEIVLTMSACEMWSRTQGLLAREI